MAGMKVVPVGTAHDGSVNMEDLLKKVKKLQLLEKDKKAITSSKREKSLKLL